MSLKIYNKGGEYIKFSNLIYIVKMEDKRLKNKNFTDALKNAISGLFYSIKTQKNIRVQLLIAIVVIILGFVLKLNTIEWLFIIFSIMFVIATEVMNTAIETTVNMYTSKYNELAKIAKDVAAGAVLIASINSVIVGVIIVLSKIKGV